VRAGVRGIYMSLVGIRNRDKQDAWMVCRSTFVLDRPDDDDEASPPLDDDDDTVSDAFVAVLILLSFETTSSSSARHST